MPKPKQKATAKEILDILDGMWLDTKDITIIAYCGDSAAWEHMKNIREIVKNKYNKKCPKGVVPASEAIDYFNINVNYLRKVAKL